MASVPVLIPLCAFIFVPNPEKNDSHSRNRDQNSSGYSRIGRVPLIGTRWFWTAICLVIGCSAGWALTIAAIDAFSVGVVSLPGRRGHTRPVVPWLNGWGYLVGLTCVLVGALISRFTPRKSGWYPIYAIATTLAVAFGYVLILFSEILSSWAGVAFLMAMLTGVVMLAWIDRRFGRRASTALLVACSALFVWSLYVATAN